MAWEVIAGAYLRGASKMWGRSTALNREVNFVTDEVSMGGFVR